MDVRALGPLDQKQCQISVPVNEYHVEFWTQLPGRNFWSSDERRLTDVLDICEALAWADAEAAQLGATYTIQAVIDRGESEHRVWLGGNNPTWGADEYARPLPIPIPKSS